MPAGQLERRRWFAIYQVVYNISDETNDDDEGSWRHNNHSRENHFHHKIKTKSLKPALRPPSSCKLKGTGPVCSTEREKSPKYPFCLEFWQEAVGFCLNY